MAAAPKPDRPRPLPETQAAARRAAENRPGAKGTPRPKWRRRAVLAVVVAAVLLWLLPAIVAHSPLLHWFLRSATRLKGAVSARSASLGWFSPSSLTGVEVRDQQGQLVLEIPRLQTDRSLLAILWNRANWGRVRLESPRLLAELREEGSNVEDVLAAYLAPRESPRAAVSVGLEIVDGSVMIGDLKRQRSWQIEKLQLTFHRSADQAKPRVLEASGRIADPADPGRFAVKLTMHPGGANANAAADSTQDRPSRDELTIDTEAVPLAMFQTLLDRFSLRAQLAGTGWGRFNWRRSGQEAFEADGKLRVRQLELALAGRPAWKEETLRATFSATGTDFAADTRVDAASLVLEAGSEWLEARLTEPVPDLRRGGPWPLEIRSTGQLAGWQARLGSGITSHDWSLAGTYDLHAEVRHSAGVSSGMLETTIDDLIATHGSGRQIREARIQLTGRGSYDGEGPSVRLEQAQLRSTVVGIDAAGQIALQGPEAEIQLAGQMACDVERLSQWLGPYTGDGVRLAGRGSHPISYQGRLSPQTARADAGISWEAGEIYGFAVGPGAIRATLSEGILQFQPLDLGVSEGRLRLAAQAGLASKPARLEVEPGRLLDQVRINPQMCQRALKYIAPVLAGVTSAEGRFSIELDACRIPFSDPAQGELAGRMKIHSVRIGPGPLIQGLIEPLALLPGRAPSAELSRESVVSFHMADGRMHHRDLELVFRNVTIRTHGSVGLDQSLALVAEIAVSPKLRTGRPLLDTVLREPRIRVPIAGTLSKPIIDRQALRQMNEQFLKDAARDMLREGLNRGLQRLFDPPE